MLFVMTQIILYKCLTGRARHFIKIFFQQKEKKLVQLHHLAQERINRNKELL